ncbi:MAG: S1 RNA-binding domain-containing protein [Burkholderiales bacterium]|nr:S1 RNA-binding domain-containing protein [Phycisphaerae bacterium]
MDQLIGTAPADDEGRQQIKGDHSGVVHSINHDRGELLVELDGKNQGVAPIDQFETIPEVGQTVEFTVSHFDEQEGIYKLLKKGAAVKGGDWETIRTGQILEGMITAMNKGGLEMQIGTMKAFMPMGQVDVQFHKDISIFLGQKAKVVVQKVDRRGKNLIVSRRAIIEQERQESKAKLFEELAEGQTRRGTVRSVMDYGAFIDIGGADGLVHVSELSHRRGVKASDMIQVGDLVDVKIVKFDRETGKISLSLKQLMADPWTGVEMKYSVGTPVTGRVARIEKFGAFIELEEGLEGLLPVSEISWQRVASVGEVLKENDILKLAVIALDPIARKLTLSLKQSGPDPWKTAAEKYHQSDIVTGTVTRLVDFGAFVELEPGLEGLIHISELADRRIRMSSEVVKAGQSTEVRIIEIDPEKRRISLSIKQVHAPAPLPEPVAVVEAPKKNKKPKQLRGGLESGWFK